MIAAVLIEDGLNININHNYYNTQFIIEEKKNKLLNNLLITSADNFVEPKRKQEESNNNTKSAFTLQKRKSLLSALRRSETSNIAKPKIEASKVKCLVQSYEQLVPCTNCSKLVHVDNVETHTDKCYFINEDIAVAEITNNPINIFNFKLQKLKENCTQAVIDSKNLIDISNIDSLQKFICKGFQLNSTENSSELSYLIEQIESALESFNGSFLNLILHERVNLIFKQKLKMLKKESLGLTKARECPLIAVDSFSQHNNLVDAQLASTYTRVNEFRNNHIDTDFNLINGNKNPGQRTEFDLAKCVTCLSHELCDNQKKHSDLVTNDICPQCKLLFIIFLKWSS